jgi:nucleoside phosphorylase
MRRTAIIFALFWELWPLARRLNVPFFKAINRRVIVKDGDIILIRSGMGKERAAEVTEDVINEFHPGNIVSAGFCGALIEDLKVGDIVISDFDDGKVFCSPRPLYTYEDKMAAHREHNKAIAVDMECEGIVSVARKYGVPCIAIKAVSDELHDEIPVPLAMPASPAKLIRLKRSATVAAERLSKFLFDYINKGADL